MILGEHQANVTPWKYGLVEITHESKLHMVSATSAYGLSTVHVVNMYCGLLLCDAVWLCRYVPTFRWNLLPPGYSDILIASILP